MSFIESLFVSVIGFTIVFLVLIALSLLLVLQSFIIRFFTAKKPKEGN